MSEKCNCEKCGNDLYSEGNVLLETKHTMDNLLNSMDSDCVGRPMFVIVIGDNGIAWNVSESCLVDDDKQKEILAIFLEEILSDCKDCKDCDKCNDK